jgi:hypothetical protein
MSVEPVMPYDFSRLDDLYQFADEFDDTVNYVCNELMELEEQAWSAVESLTVSDADAYLYQCVVAAWRSIELKYAEMAATRRSRVSSFRNTILLDVLLCSDEVDEDFLTAVSGYSRGELLRKVSDASAPWLTKYNVRLNYDSEVEYKEAQWQIFIDAKTEQTS